MASFEDLQKAIGKGKQPDADFNALQNALGTKTPEPIAPELAPSSPIAYLNRGIARMVGFPVDMTSLLLSTVGLSSDEPVGGSRNVERGFRALGVPTPGPKERAESLGQFVGQEVGAAAAGLPVSAAGAAARGSGALSQAARMLGQTAVRQPGNVALAEMTAAFGAGTGAFIGHAVDPNSELAEMLGGMAGGFGLPALTQVIRAPTRMAVSGAKKALVPFTKAGARPRAERRMEELAGGPAGRAQALDRLGADDVLESANLSPAQRTGNRRILALERAVLDADNQLADEAAQKVATSNAAVRNELRALGKGRSIDATRQFLADRRDYVLALLGERVKRAGALAEQRIAKLKPGSSKAAASRIVREEIDKAESAARLTEEQIWSAVPDQVRMAPTATRDTYADILLARNKADDPKDIPDFVRSHIGRMRARSAGGQIVDVKFTGGHIKDQEQVAVLRTFRSRLLQAARKERAKKAPNRAKLRVLGRLQEAVLEDLGALQGQATGPVGQAIETALAYSRTLNEKFTRGTVGRLLGSDVRGGSSVPETLTLESTIAVGGEKGAVDLDAILSAVDQNPAATRQQVEDFLKGTFVAQTTKDGVVQPEAARRFVERNTEILDRFPQLKADLRSARRAQEIATARAKQMVSVEKRLRAKTASRTALFLDAPVDKEIDTVLRSRDPAGNMNELIKQVRKDKSGDALKGLKAGFAEYLERAATTGQFDDAGGPVLSGSRFKKLLQDSRVSAAARRLFDRDELTRLDKIGETLNRLERAQGGLPDIGGILTDTPATILDFLARTVAARAGAQAGSGTSGASLLTAHFASTRVKQLLRRLTKDRAQQMLADAVQDEGLFKALLTPTISPAKEKMVYARLNAWITALGEEELDETNQSAAGVPVPASP